MSRQAKAISSPTDTLAMCNRAVANKNEYGSVRHIEVTTTQNRQFVFTVEPYDKISEGQIAFNMPSRKWAMLSLNEMLLVKPYDFNPNSQYVSKITLEVQFLQKNNTTPEPYDTDIMAKEFLAQFPNQAFTVGQPFGFRIPDRRIILQLTVKHMESLCLADLKSGENTGIKTTHIGLVTPNSSVVFEKGENSGVNLTGKAKGKAQQQSIINPNWDFLDMGIGGLDKEFNSVFRRAFASRVFPVELVEQLGLKHVRGILLYGPPGTGKTLMARQIGQMLNSREPKIVNGPQILDKYVGESEANIRRLFEDAEAEFKKMGNNSGLHIIIFDEIDAICKQRGSMAGSSGGVGDTVVNQLLSKIDGVESLNNILVIGMTNRRDMMDDALLRPGRLEVQIEIGLPDEKGRVQILNIHTALMRKHEKLNSDVDLNEIASLTKNFSGAELEGLVRAAQSCAMNRLIKATHKVEVDPDALEKLNITRADFMHALAHDVKPAFGASSDAVEKLLTGGIINWGPAVNHVLEDGELFIQQAKDPSSRGLVTLLLAGPPNTGKSALAAKLAISSEFPFVKLCSPDDMVGYTETAKCMHIRKVFDDAYKSTMSCILVDNIERLLDYGPIGPRYSNLVLQALLVLLKREPPLGRKLMVLCTTSNKELLEQMDMLSCFTSVLHVPNMTEDSHLLNVLNHLSEGGGSGYFARDERHQFATKIKGRKVWVGVKKFIAYIDMARQMDTQNRVWKFIAKLEEEGCLEMM